MNTKGIAAILEIAAEDKEKNIEALKEALRNNDYKVCSMSASIMLSEMKDYGMDNDQYNYWYALALLHLPQYPWQAQKE
jgi:hypothetical protein